jgi:hypothetical protein
MRNNKSCFAVRALVVAIQAAAVAMAMLAVAQAAEGDDAKRPLTQPTNSAEAGVGYVSQTSAKFGQYNGLFNQGAYGIFNFDVSGGGIYDSNDPTRWRVTGTDLGLSTRDVSAEYGEQGKFRINLGFDQLEDQRSGTYQTPYLGTGTNSLNLPSNWLVPIVPQVNAKSGNFRALSPTTGLAPANVGGVVTPPTPAQTALVNTIIANDVPDFNNIAVGTNRTTYDGGFSYNIDSHWVFKADASHQLKTGTKLLSMLSAASGTSAVVLPDLINQTTDQYNVSLNYTDEQGFFQAAYYGSIFQNSVGSMTWQNPFIQTPTFATMSTAPSNQFNQLSLTGGYNFSKTTKLVLYGSYARNTQNDQFLNNPELPLGLPRSSLNGLVDWSSFSARLTAKPTKDLSLVANYKFDYRDNRTPVSTYEFYDANEPPASTASPFNGVLGLPPGTLASNINIYANRPYSKKLNQFDLGANYAVTKGQALSADYQYQQINRTCPGSWINCADAPKTWENTLRVEWRSNAIENFSSRISYAYAQRRVDYDPNAWLALVPMANYIPAGGATTSVLAFLNQTGLGGFGPIAPWVPTQPGNLGIFFPNNSSLPQVLYGSRNDIHELPGMERFNMADRDRNKVRAAANWDASDKLSINGSLDYIHDNYSNSTFGLKNATNWAVNVEGAYAVNEAVSASLFYTYEDQHASSAGASYSSGQITNTAYVGQVGNSLVSGGCFNDVMAKNENAKVDPCLNWSTDMRDWASTFGARFKYKGLAEGRLDLTGELIYTYAQTSVGVTGGNYVNNPFALAAPAPPLGPGVPSVYFIPAAALPGVTTKMFELRLVAEYAIDKSSALRGLYWYQHLNTSDYSYAGMQYGTITSVMPTNEQAPRYNVNVIGLSYIYRWQ